MKYIEDKHRFSDELRSEVIEAYKSGLSLMKLERKYKIANGTIWRWLKKAKIDTSIRRGLLEAHDGKRICKICKKEKVLSDFAKHKSCRDGRSGDCIVCRYERQRRWRKTHKENVNEAARRYRIKYPAKIKAYNQKFNRQPERRAYNLRNCKKRRNRIKEAIIEHYGGKCECCGETEKMFLSVDHINGGGNKHRREIGCVGGAEFYEWIVKQNYPKGFQILCFNCNKGKYLNGGICPHQEKKYARITA